MTRPEPDHRRLLEAAPGLFLVLDVDAPRYTVVGASDAFAAAIGTRREDILGRGVFEVLPPGHAADREAGSRELTAALERILRDRAPQVLPVEAYTLPRPAEQGGGFEERLWRARSVPVFGPQGELTHVMQAFEDVTEWVRAREAEVSRLGAEMSELERSLRASLADLERAQSVASVGSWRLDVLRDELRWSDETYRIFGVAPGTEMTYGAFLACVHPDDRRHVDRVWTAALRGAPYDLEHRILAGDEVRWVREKADLAFDDEGRLLGGIGIVQDITERKRLEENLRLAEARSSGILSISADAIISIDELQHITMFNEGAERIFGYSRDEAIGAPLDILIPERFRSAHHQHVKRFAAGREVARRMGERGVDISGVRRNGEEFPADAAISKLDIGGKTVLTVALRDVTEARRLEKQQRFLAEVGPVLAGTLDSPEILRRIAQLVVRELADVCIVDVFEEERDVHRVQVVSRDPSKAGICDELTGIHGDQDRPDLVRSALATRRPILVEHVSPSMLETFAGSERNLELLRELDVRSMIIVPLLARGRVLGAMTLASSTRSPAYRTEDLRVAEELASGAGLAVDNARLYRVASHAIEARDQMIGIVAHDLRSPLSTVLMQAQLLLRAGGPAGSKPLRAAAMIHRSALRMDRLIQDLLDVARYEAGRLTVTPERVPAARILSESMEAHRQLAATASLDLHADIAPDLPDVWADEGRLLQVFENLIGNAVKFTPAGGEIGVGAGAGRGEVLFWVADTGPGIPREEQAHVFDRFWQARKGERRGAGLGLAIVKGIVEAHDGRVWLESTRGRGTTFFFTIPTASPDGEGPAAAPVQG